MDDLDLFRGNDDSITTFKGITMVRVGGLWWTDSRGVAERFGKNHRDVLRAIRDLECSAEFNQRNFALVSYVDDKGESRPCYRMTRDGFSILGMGFTGSEAARWKELYIEAFNAMEAKLIEQATQGLQIGDVQEKVSRLYDMVERQGGRITELTDVLDGWVRHLMETVEPERRELMEILRQQEPRMVEHLALAERRLVGHFADLLRELCKWDVKLAAKLEEHIEQIWKDYRFKGPLQ